MSFGVLTILGIAIFGGLVGAALFQRIRFPQVIGYIIIGLLIGSTGFGLVTPEDVARLKQINLFALGVIGFLVGSELKLEIFRKYARAFTSILMFEGCIAFLLVGCAVTAVVQLLTHNFPIALATGIVFGAIASATDPASTMDVIWEYRAAGPVTTATIAVIALDDALAMTLYGLGTGFSQMLTSGKSGGSILNSLGHVAYELGASLLAGALLAVLLVIFLRWIRQLERAVALAVGSILVAIGVANYFQLDVILAAMALGFVLVNLMPRRSEAIFTQLRSFAIPVYVLFFVLVGAKIDVSQMPAWLWVIVALYVLCRNLGKMAGCWIGAKLVHSPPQVCSCMGLGLFAQGGVAIGLSIVAGEYLTGIRITDRLLLSDMIVYVVTATTLVLQLSGPPMVKLALKLSKECFRNVTEEDVMAQLTVREVLDAPAPEPCREDFSVSQAVEYFAASEQSLCPVVDGSGKVSGLLSFDALKVLLADRDDWDWILVADVMDPLHDFVTIDSTLAAAAEKLDRLQLEAVPVLDNSTDRRPLGVLTRYGLRLRVRAQLLRMRPDAAQA